MASHVRVLAVLNMVLGGLGVLFAMLFFAGGALLPAILSQIDAGSEIPVAVIQVVVTIVVGIVLVLSLPGLIVGFGLWNLRPWARVMGIVLSALNLLNVPFGTVLSLYGFWVLLKPETELLFQQPARP